MQSWSGDMYSCVGGAREGNTANRTEGRRQRGLASHAFVDGNTVLYNVPQRLVRDHVEGWHRVVRLEVV